MAKTVNPPFVGADRHNPPSTGRISRRPHGQQWLALVAGAFTLAQLLLVRPGMGLGWDETVYVSQVGSHAPAAFFSAPRARGVPLLVAPIASWSSSTALLRVYLAVLSGVGGWAGGIVAGDLDVRDASAGNGWANALPDLKNQTTQGGMLYVFSLP